MITRREAAIIGAYTGVALGPFSDIVKLASELFEKKLDGRELLYSRELSHKLKELSRPLYMQLEVEGISMKKEDSI